MSTSPAIVSGDWDAVFVSIGGHEALFLGHYDMYIPDFIQTLDGATFMLTMDVSENNLHKKILDEFGLEVIKNLAKFTRFINDGRLSATAACIRSYLPRSGTLENEYVKTLLEVLPEYSEAIVAGYIAVKPGIGVSDQEITKLITEKRLRVPITYLKIKQLLPLLEAGFITEYDCLAVIRDRKKRPLEDKLRQRLETTFGVDVVKRVSEC